MRRATNKATRLLQIETLLLAHPEGLTQAEIARRLGVNRSTVHRYLPDLEAFCVYETDDGRLAIDRDRYLADVRLTLHESMALHLATRLMTTRTDKHNPHAASALRKLGLALGRLAPFVSHHILASADALDDAARRHDPVYLQVLETLTKAWSEGRKVRMWYRKASDDTVREYVFRHYFIEPYGIGQTAYVIGWRDEPPAQRTLKLERIRRIELLDERYEVPPEFDAQALLAGAWGIWTGEGEPEQVVLRFRPRVAERVCETQWLPCEETERLPDGFLVWRAAVAEPREMMPWIRGWGPDCEVLEPAWLRAKIAADMREAAEVYRDDDG
jgi:CRISPR-associated endonuclease/helicase Cas3